MKTNYLTGYTGKTDWFEVIDQEQGKSNYFLLFICRFSIRIQFRNTCTVARSFSHTNNTVSPTWTRLTATGLQCSSGNNEDFSITKVLCSFVIL